MRADVQNLFIGIHMLYCARDKDVTISEMLLGLEDLGYRVGEREVKQELEKLTLDNFLTAHTEGYRCYAVKLFMKRNEIIVVKFNKKTSAFRECLLPAADVFLR